jgi:hypothetical protein
MNTDVDDLIAQLVKCAIKQNIKLNYIRSQITEQFRKQAPKQYWVRHRNGCTKEMRERKYKRAKEELAAARTHSITAIGLSPERVRQLTKQVNP